MTIQTYQSQRRSFLRLGTAGVATPVAGLLLGACGGGASSALAGPRHQELAFPVIPVGKRLTAVSADGTKIAAHEYGNAAGKPILFIHGFSQSRLSWLRQFTDPQLTARYRICTMDLRGHGESEKPVGPYTPASHADDVHAVLQAFGISKPTIIGWSFGGLVTLDYLSAFGLSNVAKIMFVGAGFGATSTIDSAAFHGAGLTENIGPMLSADAAENSSGTLKFLLACSAEPLTNSEVAFALAYNMLATPQSRSACLQGRPTKPEDYDKGVMAEIRLAGLPVVALTGDKDGIVLPTSAAHIARSTLGTLVSYPNVGHMPFLEATARFNRDIESLVG